MKVRNECCWIPSDLVTLHLSASATLRLDPLCIVAVEVLGSRSLMDVWGIMHIGTHTGEVHVGSTFACQPLGNGRAVLGHYASSPMDPHVGTLKNAEAGGCGAVAPEGVLKVYMLSFGQEGPRCAERTKHYGYYPHVHNSC